MLGLLVLVVLLFLSCGAADAQNVAVSPVPIQRFYDNNNLPLVGGQLFIYQSGTTTKSPIYVNSSGATPNTNPIILNARGEPQNSSGASVGIWLPSGVYTFVLASSSDTDPPTNPIWTINGVSAPNGGGTITANCAGDGVTQVDACFNSAAAMAGSLNGTLLVPPGRYSIANTQTITLSGLTMDCAGSPVPASGAVGSIYGTTGTVFLINSTTIQPFTFAGNGAVGWSGGFCTAFWPGQTGATSTPVVYPPLFTDNGGNVGNVDFGNHWRIINAYDFLDQSGSTNAYGAISIQPVGYAIRNWFWLQNTPETITISQPIVDFNLYENVAGAGNKYLALWTAANGSFLRVSGNNTVGGTGSANVGGIILNGGGIFGYNKGIWVDSTGLLSESRVNGTIFDAVPHVLEQDGGGCIAGLSISGTYYSYQYPAPSGSDNAVAFSLTNPVSGCNERLNIIGDWEQGNGSVIVATGTQFKDLDISLHGAGPYGKSSTVVPYYFADIGILGSVEIHDSTIQPISIDSNHLGVLLGSSPEGVIANNKFNGAFNPINLTGNSGHVTISGNVAANTSSTQSVILTGTGLVSIAGGSNNFDQPIGAVAIEAATGLGSGSASFTPPSSGPNFSGEITGTAFLYPEGSPSANGTVEISFTGGAASRKCYLTPHIVVGGSILTVSNSPVDSTDTTFVWNNTAALTPGDVYAIDYVCISGY